jgi:hypothetical protein
MSLHRAAKRCDRGFVAPVLVAKAHIEMPFSDLLDSFRALILGNPVAPVLPGGPIHTGPGLCTNRRRTQKSRQLGFKCMGFSVTHLAFSESSVPSGISW